ncbi:MULTISPECIES: hypothetical protein [unclassified Streptomyces]|uniref:hypothetical protein n=1 Tax=unclassified Streptomyces TaxID=2593676 RepID=UPI002366C1E6|nr:MULTISPECIES: hypothetical protein [unclassified Streptomyces]MDF3141256.1 hypothetical protein [Streptomyces sp. T21Q-yed]WDF38310.1 hypothetical protein PBV52_16650 [Streptomyces sp. T12]
MYLDNGRNNATFPATRNGTDFVVRVPVSELPAGTWRGELRLGSWTLPLPELPGNLAPAKWRRRALPWYAKPVPDSDGFALQVARTDLGRAVIQRIKP